MARIYWIPAFAGMTKACLSFLRKQESRKSINYIFNLYLGLLTLLLLLTISPLALGQGNGNSPLQHFQVEGKVAFSKQGRGGNASIFWQQDGHKYLIRLIGALGAGSLEIYGRPGFVGMVQSTGETHQAKDPEQLIRQVLGWDIPVSPLRYWLQGQLVPGTASAQVIRDKNGNLLKIQQLGWSIHYDKYMEEAGMLMPAKVTLENRGIKLKFHFRHWRLQ